MPWSTGGAKGSQKILMNQIVPLEKEMHSRRRYPVIGKLLDR